MKEFLELKILEKDYHKQKKQGISSCQFLDALKKLLPPETYTAQELFAPAMFKDQPQIPYTLFKPLQATEDSPKPVIIHTHGGPEVYVYPDTPHAEIAYFVSHGYVVACPNYRGSNDYPKWGYHKAEWQSWQEKVKGKYHIYGPQDVYAVAVVMMFKPYHCGNDEIFLRGGSFGSFINAHLLTEIKKGKYHNIFTGAHLSGGIKYPLPANMPEDFPILITHGAIDEIAPVADASLFMQKLLLRQMESELHDKPVVHKIETYIAKHGNHHLIAPELNLGETKTEAYLELEKYLQLSTRFIHELCTKKRFEIRDSYDQFKLISGYNDESIFRQIYCHTQMEKISRQETPVIPRPDFKQNLQNYGPTMALLKIRLKEQFTGNIEKDLQYFLEKQFTPVNWFQKSKKIEDAGQRILKNKEFTAQLVDIIKQEEVFLKENPDHMVLYHAADQQTLQLYCFINLWRKILQGIIPDKLPVLEDMRFFDFMKGSFQDVQVFLKKMLLSRQENIKLNNLPGFADRALSCNPALISNAYATASSSLWWFFSPQHSIDPAQLKSIFAAVLEILGIYSEARLNRYLHLFEKIDISNKPQSLMQQFFIPYKQAEKQIYLCQIWGEPFSSSGLDLQSPTNIKQLIQNPINFETRLQTEKTSAFTNFGTCPGFGDIQNGFNYSDVIQLRYIPSDKVPTYSWFQNPQLHQEFIQELSLLIREDFTDYLSFGCKIPNSVLSQGEKFRKKIYEENPDLQFFKRNTAVNWLFFTMQQVQLRRGLVQNPSKKVYGKIIKLSKEEKTILQQRLGNQDSTCAVSLYELCRVIEGYTYYDLLNEAAKYAALQPESPLNKPETLNSFMRLVEIYGEPASIENSPLNEKDYFWLQSIMSHCTRIFPCPTSVFRHTWEGELENAMDSVMRHALAAKNKAMMGRVDYEPVYYGSDKSLTLIL